MTITTHYDFEMDRYELLVTSHGRTNPAGPRLFRGAPWPDVQFQHATKEAAQKDADTLQAYLDACAERKKPSKAAMRRQGAD
jgi:hypothetical protein